MSEIDAVVTHLDEALNRGDIEAVLDFYYDDAVMVIEPGLLARGKAELRTAFERIIRSGLSARQDRTYVLESGDTALFTSKWTLKGRSTEDPENGSQFTATSVFKRNEKNEWKLIIDNSFGPAVLTS